MEYSKEDLMEAKKQILGVGENMGTEESKKIWEENAQFWDNAMGDESNEFHREVVRPKVTELLSPNPADYILDIACGNGNYSSYREPNKGSEWGGRPRPMADMEIFFCHRPNTTSCRQSTLTGWNGSSRK